MTHPDHAGWAATAAAYLLGSLDDDERREFEGHLRDCPTCREELEELAPAVHALPHSVEQVAPPPGLRTRIMAEVRRDAALLAAAGPEADRPPEPPRRHWSLRLPRLAPAAIAAALLILGIAIGVGAAALRGDEAHTVVAKVDERRAPGAIVEVEVSHGTAMLVARGLPAPPRDHVYQVWLKRPGQAPEPTAAMFSPSRDGTATTTVPGPLDGVEQMLVTDEPAGGSSVPTRDPLLVADMS